jgi:hypothetical protein
LEKKKQKQNEKKWKEKHAGKVKAKFSTSSILKKKFDKYNFFKKKHVWKHCSKTKIMWGNTVTIHSVLKKNLRSKILNQLNIKKIKSNRQRPFRKKKKFIKKTM